MKNFSFAILAVFLLIIGQSAFAQSVVLRDAPKTALPPKIDCNNPLHWIGDDCYVFTSYGHPDRSKGTDQFNFTERIRTEFDNEINGNRWIESTWLDKDGTLYGWYHNEPKDLIPDSHLTAPRIGAVKSTDNGAHWIDLGIILEARPNTIDPDYKNGFFVGGNGDFSVMLDKNEKYLYIFFSTYAGDVSEQGVAIARMLWKDRDKPVGKVWKYYKRGWYQPGLGGQVTPIFPAKISWKEENADAFWGPAIHWNTYLERYVILLNRTAYKPIWPQEGVYITFSKDLGNPKSWSEPEKIFDGGAWYPQVIGVNTKAKETDRLCGQLGRFYMHRTSVHEIIFFKDGEDTSKLPPPFEPETITPQPFPG